MPSPHKHYPFPMPVPNRAPTVLRFKAILLLFLMVGVPSTWAQLRPSPLVSDGMVLQRNANVPLWGEAPAGTEVTVTFKGTSHTATTDTSGLWRVEIAPGAAGGPYELTIQGDGDSITVEDVLIGDVWLCSGQSNMEWPVEASMNAEQEIARAEHPTIRHFKVPRSWAEKPSDRLAGGEWTPATSDHVGQFTAVGYFFARELQPHVDVPIGLINSSWGGSRIEPWIRASALGLNTNQADPEIQKRWTRALRQVDSLRAAIENFSVAVNAEADEDLGFSNGDPRWAASNHKDASWTTVQGPTSWADLGFEALDGVGWYRTTVRLTQEESQTEGQLHLGLLDDQDVTWVNGTEVGRTNDWQKPRTYSIPATALRPGDNVVAVRVRDFGGDGGMRGTPDQYYLEVNGDRHSLDRPWKFRFGALSMNMNHVPTALYNKMIHPLLPFPIRGALWYQGESNANAGSAYEYRSHFKTLIRSWRADWNESGTFPFLFVQLANFVPDQEAPHWAVLRESQSKALSIPKTAQAVTIDIGNSDDIHPRNKQDVGRRLARAARALSYEQDVVYSGPVYDDHRVEDERMVLEFDHLNGGLTVKGSSLKGFTIAGPDRQFVPAEARIEGNHVVVWSDRIDDPAAVRYAWKNNPESANLFNREGLPASPFRTDTWPVAGDENP